MKNVNREELLSKLIRGEKIQLVMTLSEWEFRAKRITGSLHFHTIDQALEKLNPDQEIVLYGANVHSVAAPAAFRQFARRGFKRVSHYPGGLIDWEQAGYPLEGDFVPGEE